MFIKKNTLILGKLLTMKHLLLVAISLVTLNSYGQLQTFVGDVSILMTPSFLGTDYVVSNAQFTGNSQAVGSFISDTTNLGFEKGIVITTGEIFDTPAGPNGPNDSGSAGLDNSAAGTNLIPMSYNAAILEFDLMSLVDSIQFRYVFGSDEYPEFVGSAFNDQFRVLLSGPGINGTIDINYIPSGALASINTINAGSFSNLFVYNGEGLQAPYNQSDYYLQYDGFTMPLMAVAAVTPGETYHITIIVTDVGDGIFDSGVFIEECPRCNFNAGIPTFLDDMIECYPNPSNGNCVVNFPVLPSDATLNVINALGEVIQTEVATAGTSTFNLSNIPSGTYIIQLSSESAVWTGKLISE